MQQRLAYSYAQAGEMVGVSESSIKRWVNEGKLAYIELGGNRRVTHDDLVELLAKERRLKTKDAD